MEPSSPLRPRTDGTLSRQQLDNVSQLASASATAGMSKMQILRSLPPKRRIPYFLEQYAWPLGLGLIVIMIAVFLTARLLFPPTGPQLYVAVMDQALDVSQAETLQKRFSERSGIPEDTFATLAGYGYLVPLDDAQGASGDPLVSFPGYDDAYDDDPDYSGSGKGATRPYGIRLGADDTVWKDIQGADGVIVGLAQDSKRTVQADRFLDFLTGDADGTT